MSAKQAEANVKKLTAKGFSKTKAQKALKDCNNNLKQAELYLEREVKEREEKQRQAELEKIAEQRQKEERLRSEKFVVHDAASLPAEDKKKPRVKLHPCIQQYGNCRYGKFCAFRDLPGDTCINYILGNCIYGAACKNRHTDNVNQLRVDKFGETLDGKTADEMDEAPRRYSDSDSEDEESRLPQRLPEASAWNTGKTVAATHSDPVNAAPSWSMPVVSDAPQPFLEKLRAGANDSKSGVPSMSTNKPAARVTAPTPISAEKKAAATTLLHPCIVQFGQCKYGDACLHAFKPADVCVHFLNGKCKYGSECFYKHELPGSSGPSRGGAAPGADFGGSPMDAPAFRPSSGPSSRGAVSVPMGGGPGGNSRGPAPGSFWASNDANLPPRSPDRPKLNVNSNPTLNMAHGKPVEPFELGGTASPGSPPFMGMSVASASGGSRGSNSANASKPSMKRGSPVVLAGVPFGFGQTPSPGSSPSIGATKPVTPPFASSPLAPGAAPPPPAEGEDAAAEERAYLRLMEVFPDVPPHTLLHALRRCNNDRHRVADAVLQFQSMTSGNIEDSLRAQESTEANSPANPQPADRHIAVLTLCKLFPKIEPAKIIKTLDEDANGNYGDAVEVLAASQESIQRPEPFKPWSAEAPSQAVILKLERLEAMFPEVPKETIGRCFQRTKQQMPRCIEIFSQMMDDTKDVLEERREAGNAAMRGDMRASTPEVEEDVMGSPMFGRDSADRSYQRANEDLSMHSDWRRLRAEAYATNGIRLRILDMACAAYYANNGRAAKNLSIQAKKLGWKYRELNRYAMQALESERDGERGVSTVDLHGFHVSEALDVLYRRVRLCIEKRVLRLKVVVGAGSHSQGGKSVLMPAVLNEMRESRELRDRCRIIRQREGSFDVRISPDS